MRITFIIDHFNHELGGTENQLEKMILGLSGQFDIELISLRASEWLATRGNQLGCQVSVFQIDRFKSAYTYRNILKLVSHLRGTRPDVVHTFFPVANIIGVMAARVAGVKSIVASRRDYGEWMRRRYLFMTRLANRMVTRIVSNSHEVKRLTERVEHFPGDKIKVIYNGISLDSFSPGSPALELKQALHIPPHSKVVGLIANYRPMKRHETFVLAASEIVKTRDDIDFLLVGEDAVPGNPKSLIQQLVASLGIAKHVHFAHADGNVRDFLSILDVGVNCSEGEGLSNAIMEYMAAEVPCVVSSSGGNPDLITNGLNGYTFALGDQRDLAHKILLVLESAEDRKRFVQQAKHKIRNEMSLEAMIRGYAEFYQSLGNFNRRNIEKPI